MKTKHRLISSFLAASALSLAMGLVGSVHAYMLDNPAVCDVTNASANTKTQADQCASGTAAGDADETDFVNAAFPDAKPPLTDIFFFADKDEDLDSDKDNGFILTVEQVESPDSGEFLFTYMLAVPADFFGDTVDWVLLIKQSTVSIAYYFSDIVLGIEGGFNSFSVGRGDPEADYSHATGFVRVQTPDGNGGGGGGGVPEPGVLLLMGAGLMGLGLARRRKAA